MRFILVAAIKDVRRRLADRAALLIWIGIPLLLGGLMSTIVGREAQPRARVLVVDRDNTILSRALVTFGSGGGGNANVFDFEEVTLDEGRRRIGEGDGTALLVVPQGFQTSILENTPATIELVTNPAERILPGIVEEGLDILIQGAFYLQRLFGPALRQMTGASTSGPPSDADVAALSVAINKRLTQLQNVLVPPAIQLEVRVENPQEDELSFGQVFLPSILFMSFLFVAMGMSVDVWTEKAHGTLRRVLTTPQSAARLLAGKLLAGAVLMAGIALAGLLASVALFDVAWARVPLAVVWSVFAGTALIALLTLVQTLASSQRGGEMLSSVVAFPLMMIGGSFFPFELMPAWMASIGQWTPNGLAVVRLKELLYGTPSLTPLALSGAGIALPAAAAFLLAARRLRRGFAAA